MATKRTSKKTSSKTRLNSESGEFSSAALKLIEQAAGLLKQVVVEGSKQGAKGRSAFKKKASVLVNTAAKRINEAVAKSSSALRKGIKKF